MTDPTKPPKAMLVTGLLMLAVGLGSCTFSGRGAETMQGVIFNADNAGEVVQMGTPREITAQGTVLLVFTSPAAARCTLTGSNGKVLRPRPAAKVPVEVPDSELTYEAANNVTVVDGVNYTVECATPAGESVGRFAVANLPGGTARLSLLGITGIGGGLLTLIGLVLTAGGLFGRFRFSRKGLAAPLPATTASPPSGPSSAPAGETPSAAGDED